MHHTATTLANAAARLKAASRKAAHLPSLWLMTDAVRLADPLPAIRRLPRGSGVIVRHPDPRARARLASAVMRVCRLRGLVCLIAEDWRLAARLRADGLHLPERLAVPGICAPALLWRRQAKRLLTVAAHGGAALRRAARLRADAAVLARAFPSPSHPGAPALGPLRFAALARGSTTAVIALGGTHGGKRNAVERLGRDWNRRNRRVELI